MSDIEKLKDLLEGSRIISVNEIKNPESLCRFKVDKDKKITEFTLYATDLGYWVSDITNNDKYNSMLEMFDSIYNHVYGCQKKISYNSMDDCWIDFRCDCGEAFLISRDSIEPGFKDVLKNYDTKIMKEVADIMSNNLWFSGPTALYTELNFEKLCDGKMEGETI